jgi:hypothetical protein
MRFDLGPEPEDVFFEVDLFLVLVAICNFSLQTALCDHYAPNEEQQ